MKYRSNYPDPSVVNNLDFYSSAFRIKKLMRRRGWQNVMPMDDDVFGLMPIKSYEKWKNYGSRNKLIKNNGKEFERFVAQIIVKYYCNPATFSNKVLDIEPGGDFDILVEGPGDALFYFETKTSLEGTIKSTSVEGIWNFMIREVSLGADMTVFLYDTNYKIGQKLVPLFEILYSLGEFLHSKKDLKDVDINPWVEKIENDNYEKIGRKIGNMDIYFLYWPVVVISGGENIIKNIGESISLYYGGIKYLSPFERLTRRPTREVFPNLPNWRLLNKEIKNFVSAKRIWDWANSKNKKGDSS